MVLKKKKKHGKTQEMMAYFKFNIHSNLFSFKETVTIETEDKQGKQKKGPTRLLPVIEGKLYLFENFEKNAIDVYKVNLNKL